MLKTRLAHFSPAAMLPFILMLLLCSGQTFGEIGEEVSQKLMENVDDLIGEETNEETNEQPSEETRTEITGERLIGSPPPGWLRIYQINNGQTRLSEFVPAGEDAASWTSKLSFESYDGEKIGLDPIDLLLTEVNEDQRRCNFVQHFNIFSGLENGYQSSVRLYLCGENQFSQTGEIKLAKAIRGDEYLYSVRVINRIDAFELGNASIDDDVVGIWAAFMKTIFVCNETQAHPCESAAEDSSEKTDTDAVNLPTANTAETP